MTKIKADKDGSRDVRRTFGPWELASDVDGIRLETRKNAANGVLETRVFAAVAATTDQVWESLTTSESFRRLMPKALESRDFDQKPKQKAGYVYQRMSGGAVSERDYTLRLKWTVESTQHGKKYHRTWTVDNDKGPAPTAGVVRVEVNDGSWTLTPLPGKKTSFEQVNYIELGGNLWTVLANGAVKDSARDLARNLKAAFPG